MLHRWELIQYCIDQKGFKSYLEIGCHARRTFDKIVIDKKVSVDNDTTKNPDFLMTSDDFFKQNKDTFDIIFIDGLHHSNQVDKDFNNSMDVLNEGGIIILHDCLPRNESHQITPRICKRWVGDVWKSVMKLHKRNDLIIQVIDMETGIAVVQRGESIAYDIPDKLDYKFFVEHKELIFKPIESKYFKL